MFVQINERTLIPRMVESEVFLMKTNDGFDLSQMMKIIYPNKKNVFMVPNHEMKGYYYVNLCLSQLKNKL